MATGSRGKVPTAARKEHRSSAVVHTHVSMKTINHAEPVQGEDDLLTHGHKSPVKAAGTAARRHSVGRRTRLPAAEREPRDAWRSASSPRSEEGVRRIDVDELHALAGLGHHLGDCVPPRPVMRRFLVRRRRLGRAICLHQHEAGRIIRLLENVKTSDPWFLPAGLRVRDGRTSKSLNEVRFHFHMHMND